MTYQQAILRKFLAASAIPYLDMLERFKIEQNHHPWVEKSRLKFCKIKNLLDGKGDENINYIFPSILEMQKLLKSRNIEFIVAIYPDEYQVNDELLNEILPSTTI